MCFYNHLSRTSINNRSSYKEDIYIEPWNLLTDLPLADLTFNSPWKLYLLVGAELYLYIIHKN